MLKLYQNCFALICEAFDALERIGFEKHSLSNVFIAQTRKILLASCKALTSQLNRAQKHDHSLTADMASQLKAMYAKTLKIDGKDADGWRCICQQIKGFVKNMP